MAGVDKIIGNKRRHAQLAKWIDQHVPILKKHYLFNIPSDITNDEQLFTLMNNPNYIDQLLWHHCDIGWIKTRLKEQYGEDGPGDYT